jgi:hypothetical protein
MTNYILFHLVISLHVPVCKSFVSYCRYIFFSKITVLILPEPVHLLTLFKNVFRNYVVLNSKQRDAMDGVL